MSEHTPTPWRYAVSCNGSGRVMILGGDTWIAETPGHEADSRHRLANANRIVTAVNCHDDLLAALAGLAKVVKDTHEPAAYEVHLKHAARVIAKAKAKA